MNKRDALRLKAGDRILFGEGKSSYETDHWWRGQVKRVTDNGGVLVRIVEGRSTGGWDGEGTGPNVGEERWIPYHHVASKQD